MTRQKPDTSLSALPVLHGGSTGLLDRPLTSFDATGLDLTHIDAVIVEYERQSAVLEAQKCKTVYAMQLVQDLHRQGFVTTHQTINLLMALDNSAHFSSKLQQIYEVAQQEQLYILIDQLHKLTQIGGKNIAVEVDRFLDHRREPPRTDSSDAQRRGIVASFLFGKK